MIKASLAALSTIALWGIVACGDHDAPPSHAGPSGAGATGSGATGSGATGAGGQTPLDPASLQVEFEELALESEPTFITDFVFYPGRTTTLRRR